MKTSLILLCLALLILTQTTTSAQEDPLEEARTNLHQAIASLQEAERAGASPGDATPLAEKLNEALAILTEAERLAQDGDTAAATRLADEAIALAAEATSQINLLEERAREQRLQTSLLAYGSVPLLALATTWSSQRLYSWWRDRQDRKLLRMTPRIKKRKKEKE